MRRWGLYVSRPLGPEESINLFSGGRSCTGPLSFLAFLLMQGNRSRLCVRALNMLCNPAEPPAGLPCCRASPVPDQPGWPAARHGLLQRQLCPARPEADCAGWALPALQAHPALKHCMHAACWAGSSASTGCPLGGICAQGGGQPPSADVPAPRSRLGVSLGGPQSCSPCLQASKWCRTESSPSVAPTIEGPQLPQLMQGK